MKIVIMAGGSGTRLWPMSRKSKPKQLQKLISNKTLLEDTFERAEKIVKKDDIYISTTENYFDATAKILKGIKLDHFIVETASKNTGPAIGLVTALFHQKNKDEIIASIASDHVIAKPDAFKEAIEVAEKIVKKYPNKLVIIGINPTMPETGYGYIKMNGLFETIGKTQVFTVEEFVEKPNLATAKKYISKWQYLWNASYFIYRADTMMKLFKKFQPKIYALLIEIQKEFQNKEIDHYKIKELYTQMPEGAIDTEITEKATDVVVIPADLGWSDVGSWGSLHDVLSGITGHSVITKGHHIGIEDENILVYSGEKMIATVGLKNTVIIDTPDVTFVCDKNKSQDIKKLINKLKEEGKHLYL